MFVEVTPQVIDHASNRCRGIWHSSRKQGERGEEPEGLWTWIHRMALEALECGEYTASGKIRYNGMKFTIEQGQKTPVLKSISRVRM